MKSLQEIILEKLKIKKSSYKYFPKTKEELQDIINQLIKERGNEGDFNDIDVSKITDMSNLFDINVFNNREEFNGDMSNWDVSNVTNMEYMFDGCESFNCDISDWDVSNVEYMEYMFHGCKSFNQDISRWNVSNIKHHDEMFKYCQISKKYKPKFR